MNTVVDVSDVRFSPSVSFRVEVVAGMCGEEWKRFIHAAMTIMPYAKVTRDGDLYARFADVRPQDMPFRGDGAAAAEELNRVLTDTPFLNRIIKEGDEHVLVVVPYCPMPHHMAYFAEMAGVERAVRTTYPGGVRLHVPGLRYSEEFQERLRTHVCFGN